MIFSITFEAQFWDKSPSILILLNNKEVANEDNFENNKLKNIKFEHEIKDSTHQLTVIRKNKTRRDTIADNGQIIKDQIIHIRDIVIDAVSIEPMLDLGVFSPKYPDPWLSQQRAAGLEPQAELTYCKTLYHNGSWCLNFTTPIHVWFFQNTNIQI